MHLFFDISPTHSRSFSLIVSLPLSFFWYLSHTLSLCTSLPHYLSLSLSLTIFFFSHLYVTVSFLYSLSVCLSDYLWFFVSLSLCSTVLLLCHSTYSLYVTVTLSLYLPLPVYSLFVAPMLFSCANALPSFSLYVAVPWPLCLSLSLHLGYSLCLFFSAIFISHYPSIILNSGKKLYWISFFWWIWWR